MVDFEYGSKEWANYLLSMSIKILQDSDRPRGMRLMEVLIHLRSLEEHGFWWQKNRLQNWLHRYWHDLQPPSVVDSPEREREGIL